MIHPLFADATPSWTNTVLVVSLFCNIGMCLATIGLWRATINMQKSKQQISFDQPVIAKLEEEFVTKNDFQEHKQGNEKDIQELRDKREDDLQAAGMSRSKIYEKIESTRNTLSAEITQVPDRVIATLRNFGVIGGGHKR